MKCVTAVRPRQGGWPREVRSQTFVRGVRLTSPLPCRRGSRGREAQPGVGMIVCAACGAENAAGNRFCGDCGTALAQVCSRCGASWPPGQRFCGNCGAALGQSSATEPAVVGSPPVNTRVTAE